MWISQHECRVLTCQPVDLSSMLPHDLFYYNSFYIFYALQLLSKVMNCYRFEILISSLKNYCEILIVCIVNLIHDTWHKYHQSCKMLKYNSSCKGKKLRGSFELGPSSWQLHILYSYNEVFI